MAANVSRWLKYAQAKVNDALDSGNRELDRLEAEREARAADEPWLSADGEVPTLDEARARIQHQADEPEPDLSKVRAELDRRSRDAADRLDAIRKELGVEAPPPNPPAPPSS